MHPASSSPATKKRMSFSDLWRIDGAAFRWNIWGFMGLSLLGVAVTFALLAVSSSQLDKQEIEKTTSLAKSALERAGRQLQANARDYGRWDDMVEFVEVQYDAEWASINATSTFHDSYGANAAFVLNGDNVVIHSFCTEPTCRPDEITRNSEIMALFSGGAGKALSETREKIAAGDFMGAHGIVNFKGTPYLFGMSALVPLAKSFPEYEAKVKAGKASVLFLLIDLTPEYTAAIGKDFLLDQAHLDSGTTPPAPIADGVELVSLPLHGPDGTLLTNLVWHVKLPSERFLNLVGTPVIIVSVCLAVLLGVFAFFLRRNAAQNLEARLRAEHASRARAEFLAVMSHELRTPLNAVVGFSRMKIDEALGPLGDPEYKQYATDIHSSGNHLLEVITDILDLSKLNAGKYNVSVRDLDLKKSVESAVQIMRQRAEEAQVSLTAANVRGERIIADPTAVTRVLLNIISNAIKFTPANGRIEVAMLGGADDQIAIEVRDTGIGIPPERQAKVFEPFEQVDSTLARTKEGTGLGLSIVKALMELQKGSVRLKSEVGVGTTVTLFFKRSDRQAEPAGSDGLVEGAAPA